MSIGLILIIVLIVFLLGGFSGRFGGYGYGFGHGGIGVLGRRSDRPGRVGGHGPPLIVRSSGCRKAAA